jgi:hypothetical protein
MLILILLVLFGAIVLAGFMFMIGGFASGIGQVIAAKKQGVSLKQQSLNSATKRAREISEHQAAKARRHGYAPNVEIEVNIMQASAKHETPEEKAVREKKEARRRYLDSLVDR